MNEAFKTKTLVERVEELANRAWSQGGTDNLRLTLDALMFLHELQAETTPPVSKTIKEKKA